MNALHEDEEHVVSRLDSSKSQSNSKQVNKHIKTKTREEEIWQDMVGLLDFDDDEDLPDWKREDRTRGSDEESVASLSHAGAPKTPYYGKRSSITSNNSAFNTPTFADFGNKSIANFDVTSQRGKTPSASEHSHQPSWGVDTDMDSVIGDLAQIFDNNNDNIINSDEDKKIQKLNYKICGINIKEIMKLNRDDVYEMRSVILFDEDELNHAFKKKMGKEFCLNAAATKLIFVAGLQDRGCSLNAEQLNIVHYGVEQFLSETEYDLPSAVAKWIVYDETAEDKTSRKYKNDEEWKRVKYKLPTFLKHEMVAFIFGETYFSLTDDKTGNKDKKERTLRKKGEPVIHRNTNYIGTCVRELHNVNLPKEKYMILIWGVVHEIFGSGGGNDIFNDLLSDVSISLIYCISFYMPLSDGGVINDLGDLKVLSLELDRTWHPPKMIAKEGYNEYDNIRVKRTGRITTIPFDVDTGGGGVLLLKIYGELFIDRHATLDADSCGYSGGWQYQCQGDSIYRCGKTQ
eukprot:988820_1